MLLINRLTKVTNDPIIQGPGAINVIGVGSNKNCRNFVSCRDKVSVQLDAGSASLAIALGGRMKKLWPPSGNASSR